MKQSVKDVILEEYVALRKEKGKDIGESGLLEACLKDLNAVTERRNNTRMGQINSSRNLKKRLS